MRRLQKASQLRQSEADEALPWRPLPPFASQHGKASQGAPEPTPEGYLSDSRGLRRGATPLFVACKKQAEQGAPEQTDDGVLGVRRVRLRGATPLCAAFCKRQEKGQPDTHVCVRVHRVIS